MAKYSLKAKVRQGAGKGLARRLRREGWIPAVLYGEGAENRLLVIEARCLDALFRAARQAGALGVFLSGGGSTVLALASEGEEGIAQAMAEAAAGEGTNGHTIVTAPSNAGAQVVEKG